MRCSPDPPLQLSIGAHFSPDDGACLMELVSAVADEPWSDAPRCTHPLVAHVARLVNDASTDAGRAKLLRYAPVLVVATSEASIAYPRVALACTSMALPIHRSLLLTYLHDAASRQLAAEADPSEPHRYTRLRRWLYRRAPAHRAVEAAVATATLLPTAERDVWLRALLEAAISAVSGDARRLRPPSRPEGSEARGPAASGSPWPRSDVVGSLQIRVPLTGAAD